MKFKLLAIGDKFEYQDEVYVKTSPIIASNITGNHNKMIPGYATVKLLDHSGKEATINESLQSEKVMQAFNIFYTTCQELVEEKEALQTARDEFLQRLKS
jgi:hypothetical protein